MELNNFGPFNADLWGTVSDWVMVIVTGLTAFYLYRTLKSQLYLQELQTQLHRYDTNRYLIEIQPLFTITESTLPLSLGQQSLLVTCKNALAMSIKFEVEVDGKSQHRNPGIIHRMYPGGEYILTLTTSNLVEYTFTVNVLYFDMEGSFYKQIVGGSYKIPSGLSFYHYPPSEEQPTDELKKHHESLFTTKQV